MISRKLKSLRAEHGLTQVQIAKKLGMSEQTYVSRENGKTEFTVSEINKIVKMFDVTYKEIFLLNSSRK